MEKNKQKTSNVVHEFQIKWPSPAELFIMDYNHCDLCGEELLFTHNTNFISQHVEEEAECCSCKIKQKRKNHRLQ